MKSKRWLKLAKGNVLIVCAVVSVVLLRWRQSLAQTVLLRRTRPLAGIWCQAAGGIEANEAAWRSALPEVTDETGLRLAELWSSNFCEQFYQADRLLAFPRQRTKPAAVKVGFIDRQSHPLLQIPIL